MLSSLYIENVAVIKKINIEFSCGFMVLSGQTGAGKSIIIDSINLLLGAKADKELIRNGESYAMVSGLFTNLSGATRTILDCAGICSDEDLLIQRSIYHDGRSQIKVNGRTVNLSLLRVIAPGLVSIHGQSDTNSLVDHTKHIELVDLYSENAELLSEYTEAYGVFEDIKRRIAEISEKENERERLKEILEYQIKDIDALGLHEGEEEELVDKKLKIKHSEKIIKNSDFVFKALKGSEKGGVAYLLDRSITALSQLSGIVDGYDEYAQRLRDMLYQVEDIAEEVYASVDELDLDPTEALNSIEQRLDKISKLKRKYGFTVSDILKFRDNAKAELDTLENSADILISLQKEEEQAYQKALMIADKLHDKRVKYSKELETGVRETLEFLDMPKVVFYTSIKEESKNERKQLNPKGYDIVEFYISANLGADAQSISKIASGGELARIMLALKSVIADKDGSSTIIFDEIDAGVSGKTARKIGIKMLSLSKSCQLLCITHSAQIASLADCHYLISKEDINSATETKVEVLDYEGRVNELSRILGGINVTASQRAAAVDMLREKDT